MKSVQLEFTDGVHVFIGENAQGKTNLMESIYALAMTKSHRTTNDKELIGWKKEFATIKGTVEKTATKTNLELQFSKKGKIAKVNYLEQKTTQFLPWKLECHSICPREPHACQRVSAK